MLENTFLKLLYIHAAFIHKIEVFSKIFVREIGNIPLILYFFLHIFTFSTALEIILGRYFFLNKRIFYLTVPFCLEHDQVGQESL